ncbi:MAG: hypothetical protein A2033_11350 [Bacteroidetes bacterium GWA2_31_9]|nr:MAG: hypothetical protein A2033_11350 [Bacteroidetes bacterium GWA2_31_9]
MINQAKIIIIDDVPENLELVCELLQNKGYMVYTAKNGELGLIEIEKIKPDLILLDIIMPGLTGFDVLLKLKENIETSNIPVIFLTAIDDIEKRIKGLELGAVDYITKPFQEYDLLSRIKINLELIKNREEIKFNEEFYVQLFELHTDSVFLIENETGYILKANNQATKLYGYTIEELLNLKNTDLSAEPDETRKTTETTPLIKNNVVNIALRWNKKKDGTVFPVEITLRFFEWEKRSVHIASIRDISDRINNEKQKNIHVKILEQLNSDSTSENYLNEILLIIKNELNVDAIAIKYKNQNNIISEFAHLGYDKSHHFDNITLDINKAVCVTKYNCICGYIINTNEYLMSEFGSFFTNNLPHFINSKTEETERIEFKNTCLNAGFKSLALIPILNSQNQKVGILQLNHKTENFFNDSMIKMLENVSQSISLSLLKKDYIDSITQKTSKLNDLKNELEQIIYVTSHDLRSPLVNIHGFSNEIKKQLTKLQDIIDTEDNIDNIKTGFNKINATISSFYNYIFPSISKINTLIDGLLSLSRVGRVEVKFEQIDMNKLLKNILTVFDFKLNQNKIKLELSNLSNCNGDEKLLNQLFTNLIDNAIKYHSPKRDSVIKIYSEQAKDNVTYIIEDNGIGINDENLDKIFTIYFRATNVSSGDGLGLSIVKKIIEKHDAKISVESEFDKFTRFKITLKTNM